MGAIFCWRTFCLDLYIFISNMMLIRGVWPTALRRAVCRTFHFCKCGIQVQHLESQLTLYPHSKELWCCASISTDIENQGKTKHQYFLFLFTEAGNISLLQLLQRQGCKATKSHTNSKTNSAWLCNSALYFDHMIMMQNYIIMQNFFLNFQRAAARNLPVWLVLH